MFLYNHQHIKFGRKLRKKMTPWERKLWYLLLKDLPIKFYLQKLIGNYIVDFYCQEKNVAVEIDGGQHFEDKNINKDNERTKYLNSLGIRVFRYSNNDIDYYFEAVCDDILHNLKD